MKRTISTLAILMNLVSPAMADNLTVHEWGTFTSFMGSNGELIEGMHHEDEPLPSFVYGLKKEAEETRPGAPVPPVCRPRPGTKIDCFTMRSLIETHSEVFPEAPISAGVTQKMETPVIYFYGEQGKKVNVQINFPQGIITQYYPQATSAYPKLHEARELKNGQFVFDVTLLSPNLTAFPAVAANSIWAPARQVPAANAIKVNNGDQEKFIFYRGIGNFSSPLKVTSEEGYTLKLTNQSQSPISMAIVLNSNGSKGNISMAGALVTSKNVAVPDLNKGMSFDQYVLKAKAAITQALIQNGLYADEAVAMVNTWEKSYFHTPGIRVLYIVPNDETEAILPLQVKPTPNELVRVLVGRVEVMTKDEENSHLATIRANPNLDRLSVFGRFYESKLRRLEQIAPEDLKATIRNLYN